MNRESNRQAPSDGAREPTLTEACAPLFLYLTTFRRNSLTSKMAVAELKQALVREVDAARARCDADRRLRPLFERMHYPLVATVDQIVLQSAWTQRPAWALNLLETHFFKSAEGGKRFFKIVDQVLADPTEESRELAELLFTGMGLGFQGELQGERAELQRLRQLLYDKARLPAASGEPLAPDCYGRNNPRSARRLPTAGILRVALVALAAVVLAVVLVYAVTSRRNSCAKEIADALANVKGK